MRVATIMLFTCILDEEIGGKIGMEKFVHMKECKELNVAFALDEGIHFTNLNFILEEVAHFDTLKEPEMFT